MHADANDRFAVPPLHTGHSALGHFAPTPAIRVLLSTARKQTYLSASGMTKDGGNRMYNTHAVDR